MRKLVNETCFYGSAGQGSPLERGEGFVIRYSTDNTPLPQHHPTHPLSRGEQKLYLLTKPTGKLMMKTLVFILFVLVSVSAWGQVKKDTSAKLIMMYCGARYSKVKPLFVIDGKISKDTLSLAKIGVQNIKSISVLKDSIATAMYGDDGKNGAIIVTTKKAKTN